MKKLSLIGLIYLIVLSFSVIAQDNISTQEHLPAEIVGFWKTVNEKTMKPESVIAIYQYHGQYFGRIMLTYDNDGAVQDTIYQPKKRASGVVGNPYYVGMDIIWGLKKEGDKYKDGSILDPEKGYIYGAEAWKQGEKLIVRGKLLMFGRNQTWPPAEESDFPEGFRKPDLTALTPLIPKTI